MDLSCFAEKDSKRFVDASSGRSSLSLRIHFDCVVATILEKVQEGESLCRSRCADLSYEAERSQAEELRL